MTPAFRLISRDTTIDLLALSPDLQFPVADLVISNEGTYVLAMDRDFDYIELGAQQFNTYLKDEGFDHILEWRKSNGTDQKPGRERYARNMKAIVQVGNIIDESPTQIFDQTIDIVPAVNPYTLKKGDQLECLILFNGKPLVGVKVDAIVKNQDKTDKQSLRSDSDGKVNFELNRAGVWLIRLIHMFDCKDKSKADWESWWASLTFAI